MTAPLPDQPADVPKGQRNRVLRDTAFAMARQGYTNHEILAILSWMSEEMGKYTDANLFQKWTRLLGMVREVRSAGIQVDSPGPPPDLAPPTVTVHLPGDPP